MTLHELQNLPKPEITIEDAIEICEEAACFVFAPRLAKVIERIRHLRHERDLLHKLARGVEHGRVWDQSECKKWADKQSQNPDND
jgi:phosphopantothenoylcysteine synthetase/decarboxylase